jgi:hypothetical protein
MPLDRVWWVDQSVAVSGDGSEGSEFKTIAEALALIDSGEEGTIIVATPGNHDEQVVVLSGRTVALLGDADGGDILFTGAPPLDINTDASVFVGGISVTGSEALVRCNSADLWVHDSDFSNGQKQGLLSTGCSVFLNRTDVVRNDLSGIDATGGSVQLYNSIVGRNGDSLSVATRGIKLSNASLTASHVTIARNQSMAQPAALECTAGPAIDIRNSILLSGVGGDAVTCDQLVLVQSATDDANFQGGSNVAVGPFEPNWFAEENNADYHLGLDPASGPFVDVAVCDPSIDMEFDIDQQLRACDNNSASYAGADEP